MPQQVVTSPPLPHGPALRWLSPTAVLLISALLAVLMSTQYLFQVFVWRHWPVDEVIAGWLEVARDRLVVALMIGTALLAASRMSAARPHTPPVLLAGAILVGAMTGELLLLWAGAPGAPADPGAVAGRIARWSVVAGSVAAMAAVWRGALESRVALQAAELRRVQLERETAAARLAALRVQIEPHFLFNTLATVRRLHQTEPTQGTLLLDHFIGYLRAAQADAATADATLAQEMALSRAYLGVVVARMSGRLVATFDVPARLEALPFPALTIATLVENAVKHGIAPLPRGGAIHVSARAGQGWLEVVVADTGAGFVGSSGSGIGLANIRSRLETLYGAASSLTLRANLPTGVCASIRIPVAEAPQ